MITLSPEGYKVQAIFKEIYPELFICEHLDGKTGCNLVDVNCPYSVNSNMEMEYDWDLAKQYCKNYKPKGIKPMEVGDYFCGEQKKGLYNVSCDPCEKCDFYGYTTEILEFLHGNLVEIKVGDDFGIHTEQLERFQDECYRMACYRQKNPYVCLHAVWINYEASKGEIRRFNTICFKYHIWGHVFDLDENLVDFLKRLPRDSEYKEFEPFIKRSHEEPTILAKMLRQFPGISSEKAIELAEGVGAIESWFYATYEGDPVSMRIMLNRTIADHFTEVFGLKKNGQPRKLHTDFLTWLETGDAP